MELSLSLVPGVFWVAKAADADPSLIAAVMEGSPGFWTISHSDTDVSVVSTLVDHDLFMSTEGPFMAFRVDGSLDFSLTGILSRCSGLLAKGGVSVFCVSTFDTDYFLVPADNSDVAVGLWEAGGIPVSRRIDT